MRYFHGWTNAGVHFGSQRRAQTRNSPYRSRITAKCRPFSLANIIEDGPPSLSRVLAPYLLVQLPGGKRPFASRKYLRNVAARPGMFEILTTEIILKCVELVRHEVCSGGSNAAVGGSQHSTQRHGNSIEPTARGQAARRPFQELRVPSRSESVLKTVLKITIIAGKLRAIACPILWREFKSMPESSSVQSGPSWPVPQRALFVLALLVSMALPLAALSQTLTSIPDAGRNSPSRS